VRKLRLLTKTMLKELAPLASLLLDYEVDRWLQNATNTTNATKTNSTNTTKTNTTNATKTTTTTTVKPPPLWQTGFVAAVLILMFLIMLSDYVGPDLVMFAGLLVFIVSGCVPIKDALVGFSNEGILTVMVLFVVAEGISRTGALDHYLGKLLGRPKTIPGAQIRLMIPIATLSAFLNNTPIVAVMIPVTLRWAKTIGIPKEQLLIPLSYATILGGTCTLVGTSTNLVVSGLLSKNYPKLKKIGLFYVGIWGVPNAILGIAYIALCGQYILPKGKQSDYDAEEFLLGAKVLPWSPAVGRTFKRSGLRDAGVVTLVSVRRAATGNVLRDISDDYVFSAGDELFFTGGVDKFSKFAKENALEVITTNNILPSDSSISEKETDVAKGDDINEVEHRQSINLLSDKIQGRESVQTGSRPSEVFVARSEDSKVVLVGVDARDRPGLLVEISTVISQHDLNVRYSEAKVFGDRSLSVWRNEETSKKADLEILRSAVLSTLLYTDASLVTRKIIRTLVTKSSALIGKKPIDVDFVGAYRASIVAYQKNGRNVALDVPFGAEDLLVLEVDEDSPLLTKPPTSSILNLLDKSILSKADDIEASKLSNRVWKDLQLVVKTSADVSALKGEFLTPFFVPHDSPLKGKTLSQLGYNNLPGVVLVSIECPSNKIGEANTAITADDPLLVGDVFWYLGSAEDIGDLQKVNGLVFYQAELTKRERAPLIQRRLVQAVVAKGSPLVGHTVTDARFRTEYGGVVIAIKRGNNRIREIPSHVKLHAGDLLLIEAGSTFVPNHRYNFNTFALIKEVEGSNPPRPRMFLICVALIATSLAVAALEYQSLMTTAGLVGVLFVMLGVLTQNEARNSLQWDIFITVASAFGVSNAMTASGVSKAVAGGLVKAGLALGIGNIGVYGSVYLAGNLLSAILTNNAAATLMFPIAMNAVDRTGADRFKMAIILMLSASDYITSFGYQTNLMVCAPGGYSNMDYLKFGAPMQIILWVSSVAFVGLFGPDDYKWIIAWVACSLFFIVVAILRLTNWRFWKKKTDESALVRKSTAWQFHDSAPLLSNKATGKKLSETV